MSETEKPGGWFARRAANRFDEDPHCDMCGKPMPREPGRIRATWVCASCLRKVWIGAGLAAACAFGGATYFLVIAK